MHPLKILIVGSMYHGHQQKRLKDEVGNYRPVSITSVVCKMMESVIRHHIVSYMSNNLFVPNRDCMTNLLSEFGGLDRGDRIRL